MEGETSARAATGAASGRAGASLTAGSTRAASGVTAGVHATPQQAGKACFAEVSDVAGAVSLWLVAASALVMSWQDGGDTVATAGAAEAEAFAIPAIAAGQAKACAFNPANTRSSRSARSHAAGDAARGSIKMVPRVTWHHVAPTEWLANIRPGGMLWR